MFKSHFVLEKPYTINHEKKCEILYYSSPSYNTRIVMNNESLSKKIPLPHPSCQLMK